MPDEKRRPAPDDSWTRLEHSVEERLDEFRSELTRLGEQLERFHVDMESLREIQPMIKRLTKLLDGNGTPPITDRVMTLELQQIGTEAWTRETFKRNGDKIDKIYTYGWALIILVLGAVVANVADILRSVR